MNVRSNFVLSQGAWGLVTFPIKTRSLLIDDFERTIFRPCFMNTEIKLIENRFCRYFLFFHIFIKYFFEKKKHEKERGNINIKIIQKLNESLFHYIAS